MELTETIIRIAIATVVLVVVVWLLFFGPGKQVLIQMGLLSGLTKSAEETNSNNFDLIIQNIESCKAAKGDECLCTLFPSWPGTFARNTKLSIVQTGENTKLDIIFNNKPYRTGTGDSIRINAMILETKSPLTSNIKTLDWKQEPPLFLQEGLGNKGFLSIGKQEFKVISGYAYKRQNDLFILISEKPNNGLSELDTSINAIKKC